MGFRVEMLNITQSYRI